MFIYLTSFFQLEEANTLLRAESEAAVRLRKTQTESSKQLQQLEANLRELQDKCCLLERSKLSLEKECISLQAVLEAERREHSQGSETISDLMGETLGGLLQYHSFTLRYPYHTRTSVRILFSRAGRFLTVLYRYTVMDLCKGMHFYSIGTNEIVFWFVGRISGLEEEVRQARQALSKDEMEKRQLQERLTDLEKVFFFFFILTCIYFEI